MNSHHFLLSLHQDLLFWGKSGSCVLKQKWWTGLKRRSVHEVNKKSHRQTSWLMRLKSFWVDAKGFDSNYYYYSSSTTTFMECGQYGLINYLISFGTFLKVDIWFSILDENIYEELRLQGLFLPLRWSYLSSAGGSWSTPPVSAWWGRPLSAVSWSGRSSRTTEWSLWRGTLPWTVNTGRSWRSAASVWESLLPYQWCS